MFGTEKPVLCTISWINVVSTTRIKCKMWGVGGKNGGRQESRICKACISRINSPTIHHARKKIKKNKNKEE